MSLSLPYKPKIDSSGEWLGEDDILRQLVEKCTSNNDYEAICMIESGAWDIETQSEIIQLKDGTFLVHSWTDPSEYSRSSRQEKVRLNIDLTQELLGLKSGQFTLGSGLNKNPDLESGKEFYRVAKLYIAVGTETAWFIYPRQAGGGVYENNALNRICYAFSQAFSVDSKPHFSLMDELEAKPIIDAIDSWPMYFMKLRYELREQIRRDGSIKACITKALAQSSRDEGLELQPFQPVEIIGAYTNHHNRSLLDFKIRFSE